MLLPEGFVATALPGILNSPTAMAIAADGRIFVTQQGGEIRVYRDAALLASPFYTVSTVADDERGLIGIALDPSFASNGFVYVCYTESLPAPHNVILRLTADPSSPDQALAGSENVLFELDTQFKAFHLGGALAFGPDEKLYTVTGETGGAPRNFTDLHGKVLRLSPDGSIPNDNPFPALVGRLGAIYALGFRNPFTFAIQASSGRIFVNDIGSALFEEIDLIVPGGDYGYPGNEGPPGDASIAPFLSIPWGGGPGQGRSIAGGVFYEPATTSFPSEYTGRYFFADFVTGRISTLDPSDPTTEEVFAEGFALGPVGLGVGATGALFSLVRGQVTGDGGSGAGWDTGSVIRIGTARRVPAMSPGWLLVAGTILAVAVVAARPPRRRTRV